MRPNKHLGFILLTPANPMPVRVLESETFVGRAKPRRVLGAVWRTKISGTSENFRVDSVIFLKFKNLEKINPRGRGGVECLHLSHRHTQIEVSS